MIKHCCDVCGKIISKPESLPGHSNTNLAYTNLGETNYLELCDECMKAFEAFLKLRKGFADVDRKHSAWNRQ